MSRPAGTAVVATRAAFVSMTALFTWAAFLQLNDVDPFRWLALYGSAAGLCLSGAFNRPLHPAVGLSLAVVVLAYAGRLAWVIASGDARPMYGETGAADPPLLDLEQGREVFGLVLIAAASGAHAAWSHRRR